MSARRFEGVYPVLYNFYGDTGALDRGAMAAQVEHCIAAGAHGVMVLGLVTEVHKLDVLERRAVVDLVGELVGGRVPYAVTVGEPSIEGQLAFSRAAKAAGADWVILQPPPGKGFSEASLIRFFGAVANALDLPVAIQNNPVNLDAWLSPDGLVALHRQHPNVSLLKGEGAAVDLARVIEETEGALAVFGGHGGLEFLSLLRAGAAGLIPAPDVLPAQVRIFELMRQGTPEALAEAERLHKELLPLITFMVRSIPHLLCYGKRFMARRLGFAEPYERPPALAPTTFGLSETDRFFHALGALEHSVGLGVSGAP